MKNNETSPTTKPAGMVITVRGRGVMKLLVWDEVHRIIQKEVREYFLRCKTSLGRIVIVVEEDLVITDSHDHDIFLDVKQSGIQYFPDEVNRIVSRAILRLIPGTTINVLGE